jgi:serine/threonine protein kinase/tetratricopeptide (TPR) repeat protein
MTEPTMRGVAAGGGPGLPCTFGSFTLLKQIARGERGEVFAALRPVEVERFCAIKILSEATTKRPEFVPSLRNEATRVVRRIHGNLVQMYDVGLYEQRLFFVSELIDGVDLGTLQARLRERRQAFPVDVAIYVAMEVAAALGYLRRLAARAGEAAPPPPALSPGSVLLSVDGEIKVLHYGTTMAGVPVSDALVLPASEGAGTRVAASAASDVYLVGLLLRRLLPAAAPVALPARPPAAPAGDGVASATAPLPLPLPLTRLIERTLAPDPAARPADSDELRGALATILRNLKGGGGTPPVGELVRAAAPQAAGSREALAAVARSFDPKRGASPPTWKVITLTRLETGAAGRAPKVTSAPVDLTVGQVIPGTRYRILSKLGEGGMGTVYAAEHVDLEKKVALKVLRSDVAPDAETLQQFRQEARAASKIGSAYICDVTDFGELSDGRVFFVMEYLDGQSLGRVLRQDSQLDPGRVIAVLRQVAKALGAAHEKGIVHLDVKPDNVMLLQIGKRPDGVKVVDFGIAGLLHQSGEEEEIAGTPEYIAPERASGHGYDSRSDVYALGVMAYEMLSGNVPFHGKNHVATLTMQVKDPPEPLRRQPTGHGVPEPLEELVMRMLQKDPAARPQSMVEVEALLCEAQIAAGLTTTWDDLELPPVDDAWRARLLRRMPSAVRPRRAVVFGAGSVAAVSLAAAIYLGFIRKPAVVVREVRVELTKTDEAPAVAAALLKADQAARRERYVRPVLGSALYFIQMAEDEAKKLGRRSSGALALRRAYASALTVVGNELMKADLRDLGLTKYKEALMFLPDDADLQAKAELSADERRRARRDDRRAASEVAAPSPEQASLDAKEDAKEEAKDQAARVFLAATRGRLSEARLALKPLTTADVGGGQRARLADVLRARAASVWAAGRPDDARPIYALVADLDPGDLEAKGRAGAPAAAPAPSPAAPAAAPVRTAVVSASSPSAVPAPLPASKSKRLYEGTREPEDSAPRDTVASQRAADAGVAAMARGRLADAEEAFNRAVRADSTNAVAVGGLAEVAFERARYSDALDYARRATHLAPRVPKYLILTGDAYFKLLRYDEALASYEKGRALAPHDEALRSRVERVQAKLGNK